MAFSVHDTGRRSALANIGHGNVDTTSPWSFTAADGNALLGTDGNDTASYAKAHLGIDPMNPDPLNKFAYPVAKGGIVYRSGLAAASHNASNAGDNEVADVADGMIDMMDGGTTSSGDTPDTWSAYPFEYKLSEATPGTFEGYASVFNVKDDNGDLILPGSFGRTLAASQASGRSVKMFVNHAGFATGTVTANDLIPCGVWTALNQDSKGLEAKGRLIALDTDRGKSMYAALKERALSDMSIGYKATNFTRGTTAGDPRRSISELSLYEISPVFYPANPEARITSVASLMRGGDPRDIRFLERVLRDVGLSGREAKAVLAGGFKAMVPPRDAGASNSLDGLLGALRQVSGLSRST
jgi:HK97 family phage prohead protease